MNTMANNIPLNYAMCYASYNPTTNMSFPFHPIQEDFRQISAFIPEVQDYYYVSNYGRVYNSNTGYLVAPSYASSGYEFYVLRRKPEYINNGKYETYTVSAQILVCTCFVGAKPGPEYQVYFKDSCNHNNYYENLEWLTKEESMAKSSKQNMAANNFTMNAKYTEAQVRGVCEMFEKGIYDYDTISRKVFGIDANIPIQNFIYNVLSGDTWAKVSSEYTFDRNAKKRNFVPENIIRGFFSFMQLCPMYAYTTPSCDVLKFIGIDPDSLDNATRNRYYNALSNIRNTPDSYRNIRKDFNIPPIPKK